MILCSFPITLNATNTNINPYPATNFTINGIPYLAYEIPIVAKRVLNGLQDYEYYRAREKTINNIISNQESRYISFKILTKAQKKKRIAKGFIIAGIVIDNLLKSFAAGYGYKTLQNSGVFP